MKHFMNSLSKLARWIIIVGLYILFSVSAKWYYPERMIAAGILGPALIAFIALCLIYKSSDTVQKENHDAEIQRMNAENKAEAERRKEEEAQAKRDRQAEWERTHGRILTKIVGVTFTNDDGTDRQTCLKAAYIDGGDGTIQLETYDYKGAPAVRVIYDDMCVGNIPAETVDAVVAALPNISGAHLDVENFKSDAGESLYRADLTIVYLKQPVSAEN